MTVPSTLWAAAPQSQGGQTGDTAIPVRSACSGTCTYRLTNATGRNWTGEQKHTAGRERMLSLPAGRRSGRLLRGTAPHGAAPAPCDLRRGNRKKSEHYGLWVWLCVAHHEYGPEAVHTNARIRRKLSQVAQMECMRVYPNLDFREEFGISYLDPNETPQTRIMTGCGTDRVEDGFTRIETGLETGMPF